MPARGGEYHTNLKAIQYQKSHTGILVAVPDDHISPNGHIQADWSIDEEKQGLIVYDWPNAGRRAYFSGD
ncbi:hypothetical protein GCM10025791_16830 [Halioxenophilus aromaticivorans]|uniref:Uncharacterized protein n=2 Tax=Halioxenophilus aromaticivorans TaxID=1306992 RepID=A0AAV3U183_9ALTE